MPRAKKSVRKNPIQRDSGESKEKIRGKYFWAGLRISIGFIFIWPFFDKLFGLGFSTAKSQAWINGGSPVAGFLLHSTYGPLASVYQSIAGSSLVSWLFMLGLLFVGLTMILGIGMKLSSIVGTAMMFLMWSSMLPPTTTPFMDYHWMYAAALIASVLANAGNYFGLGKWWSGLRFVRKCPILK